MKFALGGWEKKREFADSQTKDFYIDFVTHVDIDFD